MKDRGRTDWLSGRLPLCGALPTAQAGESGKSDAAASLSAGIAFPAPRCQTVGIDVISFQIPPLGACQIE